MRIIIVLSIAFYISVADRILPSVDARKRDQYRDYLVKTGKSIERADDVHRLEQFSKNLDLISKHLDSSHSSYNIAVNHFADLLPEELEAIFIRSAERDIENNDERQVLDQTKPATVLESVGSIVNTVSSMIWLWFPWSGDRSTAVNPPHSINWASRNNPLDSSVMSAVRNQGSCGACWAFVAVATSEAALRISLSQGSTGKKTRHMKDSVIMRRLEATTAQSNEHFESRKGAVGYLSSVWGDEGDPFDAYAKALPSAKAGDDVSHSGHNHIVDGGNRKKEDSNRENSVENGDNKESQDVFVKTEDASAGLSNADEPLLSSPKLAWIPSLSVQQLIDCDNSFNKGCSGGSPLIALHYISDNGLVPWSRYEYEEQVDVCTMESAGAAEPVAKYFIKDFGKLEMFNSEALKEALMQGPVALGICGTDPHFLLYSSGVFDLATCCTEQNHALTLVGYGHDSVTGLDYWLAQNSWGTQWGEAGYIKLKRSTVLGEPGICGMLLNPMYGRGGYILDEKGRFIDPTRTAHYPVYVTNWIHWVQDNWREVMLLLSAFLLALSVAVLLYACYLERLLYLAAEVRARRDGYQTISDAHTEL